MSFRYQDSGQHWGDKKITPSSANIVSLFYFCRYSRSRQCWGDASAAGDRQWHWVAGREPLGYLCWLHVGCTLDICSRRSATTCCGTCNGSCNTCNRIKYHLCRGIKHVNGKIWKWDADLGQYYYVVTAVSILQCEFSNWQHGCLNCQIAGHMTESD